MSEHIEIGKISHIKVGFGGYQDAMFGVSFAFSGKSGWGCGAFEGSWGTGTKVDKHTKWTEEDRNRHFAEAMRLLNDLCIKAKVSDVNELRGVPIRAYFDSPFGSLLRWEILEEVL